MTVYCVSDCMRKALKVGFTQDSDPIKRVRSLQTASPFQLDLLYYRSDMGRKDEESLHSILAPHKTNGGSEWFDFDRSIGIVAQYMGFDWQSAKPIEIKTQTIVRRKKPTLKPKAATTATLGYTEPTFILKEKEQHWFLESFCVNVGSNSHGLSPPQKYDDWCIRKKASFSSLIKHYSWHLSEKRYKSMQQERSCDYLEPYCYVPKGSHMAGWALLARRFADDDMSHANWHNAVSSWFWSHLTLSRLDFLAKGDAYINGSDLYYACNLSPTIFDSQSAIIDSMSNSYHHAWQDVVMNGMKLIFICVNGDGVYIQHNPKNIQHFWLDAHLEACKHAETLDELLVP